MPRCRAYMKECGEKTVKLKTIAHIRTDFPEKFGIPRQSGLVKGLKGRIVFESEYRNPDAIRGIEGFSHLWLIWGFSEVKQDEDKWCATVAPPRLGGRKRMGVFATRSPFRPNPIGLSSVKLEGVEYDKKLGCVLVVSGVDMLDGTPIYDIKPYLPYADVHEDSVGGFGDEVKEHRLEVVISPELMDKIPEEERENVIQILMEDPRTAFIHDKEREWGISYGRINVRFKVVGNVLTVTQIDDI